MQLTEEQLETIHELREEIRDLHLEADAEWAKYIKTGDVECYEQVLALDSEILMKGMIAHIPKDGEQKIGRVRNKLRKLRGLPHSLSLPVDHEARLRTLDSINEWRASLELPPLERLPRGVPGDTSECVIARAMHITAQEKGGRAEDITVNVSGTTDITVSWWDGNSQVVYEPRIDGANELITSFDSWHMLDLVQDPQAIRNTAEDTLTRITYDSYRLDWLVIERIRDAVAIRDDLDTVEVSHWVRCSGVQEEWGLPEEPNTRLAPDTRELHITISADGITPTLEEIVKHFPPIESYTMEASNGDDAVSDTPGVRWVSRGELAKKLEVDLT